MDRAWVPDILLCLFFLIHVVIMHFKLQVFSRLTKRLLLKLCVMLQTVFLLQRCEAVPFGKAPVPASQVGGSGSSSSSSSSSSPVVHNFHFSIYWACFIHRKVQMLYLKVQINFILHYC